MRTRTCAAVAAALMGLLLPMRALPGEGGGEAPPAPAAAPAGAPGEQTLVTAGDTLDIVVFGHPELSRVVTVQTDGSVALPFIGRVEASGRPVEVIAAAVAEALGREYRLRDPRVSVAISTYRVRSAYILGRVRSPGSHPFPFARPLTLLQSIALTGGYMDDADRGRIRVQRTGSDGSRRVLTVDLTGVEVDGDMSRDIPLEDGDTVFVPRSEEVSVLGQVGAPGTFIIPSGQPLTLLRAIARTGGFTRLAKQSAVIWIRRTREGGKPTIVDADAILEGRLADPAIGPGDVLYVPERAF